ncbi:MAG TPA: zinc-binding alcohol dehydrogenase family protein [Bryobacteraceae bacterium]|nr:zinc-binding alcohol dehydrogenase family protein [Bryobacteraceae bacterium]
MKCALLHEPGGPPRYEELPDPVPGEGETIVRVLAASIKPVDRQMASGTHYASPREFPVVCGIDGVGQLEDGTRVFFGGPRRPYGAMAERTVVARARCWPVPAALDDATAAALPNPALSSWLPLMWSARLAAGETVLILGATGTAGRLAIQIARLLGAGRVVAAGRNPEVLRQLPALGADAVISLDGPDADITQAFAREAGEKGYDVIVDYVWGRPTELLLASLNRGEFSMKPAGPRLIPIGESAAPAISLPAAVLRSAALSILGGGFPPFPKLLEAFHQALAYAVEGKLRIATERVKLQDITEIWRRPARGPRLVVIP